MERTEKTLSANDLIQLLKQEGLLVVRADEWKQESLKDKILKKKWITLKEIADSKVWGVGKEAVKDIVKKEVDPDSIDTRKPPFKVHRLEVERIAKNRNTI